MGRPARAALAVATGVVAWLSFPGVGAWPLAFVAWVPLLLALDGDVRPRDAALYGWLSGLTMTSLATLFVLPAIHFHGGFSIVGSLAMHVVLSAYLGLRIAFVTLLASLAKRRGWSFPLSFLLAFAGAEVAFPEPFPWTFGASIHRVTVLAQAAEIGGAPLLGAIVVCGSLGVHAGITRKSRGLRWLVVPATALLYGVIRLSAVDDEIKGGTPLTVGIVQPHLEMFHPDPAAAIHAAASEALRDRGAELVVFSEAPLPGPYPEEDLEGALGAIVTRRIGVSAIVGVSVRRTAIDDKRYFFNSAIFTDAQGHTLARYDKHRLVPFGEYVPAAQLSPSLRSLSPRSGDFSPGSSEPLNVRGLVHPMISICFEDVLAEQFRALVVRERPNLLVNMTNDGWFEHTSEPIMHAEMARVRAIEHRRYLVRATNSGLSIVIDPAGRTVAMAPESERTTLLAQVKLLDASTVYETIGDGPEWAALGAVIAFAFLPRPRARRSPQVGRRPRAQL